VIESTPGTEASDVRQTEVRWVPRELKRDVTHLTSNRGSSSASSTRIRSACRAGSNYVLWCWEVSEHNCSRFPFGALAFCTPMCMPPELHCVSDRGIVFSNSNLQPYCRKTIASRCKPSWGVRVVSLKPSYKNNSSTFQLKAEQTQASHLHFDNRADRQ
jgi:hypothetical protein